MVEKVQTAEVSAAQFQLKAGMTREEIQNAGEEILSVFNEADTDGNNEISQTELDAYMTSKPADKEPTKPVTEKTQQTLEKIKELENKKKTLLQQLKTGNYTDEQKYEAAVLKHQGASIAKYTGMLTAAAGGSGIVLGAASTALGGIGVPIMACGAVAAGIGAGISWAADKYIKDQIKNLTEDDMKKYIQNEIDIIDSSINYYKSTLPSR